MGYLPTSKAYRVFNKRTLVVEESMNVTFDETNSLNQEKGIDEDVDVETSLKQMSIQEKKEKVSNEDQSKKSNNQESEEKSPQEQNDPALPKEWKFTSFHPKELIIDDPSKCITTRTSL